MLINALCICTVSVSQLRQKTLPYATALHKATDTICLLICAMTFLLIVSNTRLLVDTQVYFDNKAKLDHAASIRLKLFLASALVSIVVIAIELSRESGPKIMQTIGTWAIPALRAIFILTWVWKLVSLHRILEQVEKLSPKNKQFKLQGTLLASYMIIGGLAAYTR